MFFLCSLLQVAQPLYGHAAVGERAIEVVRYHSRPNVTLHLLGGLTGVDHCKVTRGQPTRTHLWISYLSACILLRNTAYRRCDQDIF